MAVIIDGTDGITTPTGTGDVSVGDDLTFTGTGNRITGDFSTGTTANRVAFQTSTASGATIINVLPGSGAIGSVGHNYFNDPNVNNCARFEVGILNAGTEARLSSTIIGSGSYLPMTFLTGGSERARIDPSGEVGIGMAGASSVRLAVASGSSFIFVGRNSAGNTDQIRIASNGNVTNLNNSYAGLSDFKIKENIVDATPKLNQLCQVRVVNFNLKEELGYNTQKQIGVVAQELEQIFPALIDETADWDEEGNDLGTTTKSVKYSVFVPMLIKAIQEQQTLIQALTARIEALEQA